MTKNASLTAKSNARLAAVQLLYRDAMTGGKLSAAKLMAEYAAMRNEGGDAKKEAFLPSVAPENALLGKLLEGVKEHRAALEATLAKFIREDWKPERMGALMVNLLLTATFELDSNRTRATNVLVDEYTTLANRLLGEDESTYVHAALHQLAKHLRE